MDLCRFLHNKYHRFSNTAAEQALNAHSIFLPKEIRVNFNINNNKAVPHTLNMDRPKIVKGKQITISNSIVRLTCL